MTHKRLQSNLQGAKIEDIRLLEPERFGSMINGVMDEMGTTGNLANRYAAIKVIEQGWGEKSERDFLRGVATRWGDAIGANIPVTFDEGRGGGVSEGSLNFSKTFAKDVHDCPDLIGGHEAGHVLEHSRTEWAESQIIRKNDYNEDYVRMGFIHNRHPMPPFSLVTHHQLDVSRVFSGGYNYYSKSRNGWRLFSEDIGYNARQIYCDTIPFKEVLLRGENGESPIIGAYGKNVTIDSLIEQYISYLDQQFDRLTKGDISFDMIGRIPKNMVPVIARFGGSAWGMEILAKRIQDPEIVEKRISQLRKWSDGFLSLFGRDELGRGEILKLRERSIKDLDESDQHLLNKFQNGCPDIRHSTEHMSPEETLAILILVRAFKRHFLACIGEKDLMVDDDLRPHIERLRDGPTPLKIREIRFTSDITDHRPVEELLLRLNDMSEEPIVRREALATIRRVEKWDNMHPLLKRLMHTHPDECIRWEAASTMGQYFGRKAWPDFKHVLNNDKSPDVRAKVCALIGSLWRFGSSDEQGDEINSELDRLMRDDPSPEVRASLISHTKLKYFRSMSKLLMERYDADDDSRVRGYIIDQLDSRYQGSESRNQRESVRQDGEMRGRDNAEEFKTDEFTFWLSRSHRNEPSGRVKKKIEGLYRSINKRDLE